MTQKQKQLRRYYFRELVAHCDHERWRAKAGPLVLTLKDAREMWRAATVVARASRHGP